MTHGGSCYYARQEVKDGDWEKCTCLNKIPRGPIDRDFIERLKQIGEIDRTARAYGFEIGQGHPLVEQITELSEDNPFMDPNWRTKING